MNILRISAVVLLTACSSGAQAVPVSNALLAPSVAVRPDLKLQPSTLHFRGLKRSKREVVFGFNPGGGYHDTCEGLGVAHIGPGKARGSTEYFKVTPDHRWQCQFDFVHVGNKTVVKTLTVIVTP
jgi:hypothetical protein